MPNLMSLIEGCDNFQKILVVESSAYVKELRQRFSAAEIFLVTADEDAAEIFSCDDVKAFVLDYREERLPFEEEFFDAIIGELT